jgi:hypothetical protein
LGETSFHDFATGTDEFLSPIHRINIPLLLDVKKKTSKKAKTGSLASDRALFGRLIVAAQFRKVDLAKLFSHELAKYPLSLADIDGNMRKSVKSNLMAELEKEIEDDGENREGHAGVQS